MSSQVAPFSAPPTPTSAAQFIKSHCSHEIRLQRSPPHLPSTPLSTRTTDLREQFTKRYPDGLEVSITRSLDLAQETVQATDELFSSVRLPDDLSDYVKLVAKAYQRSSTGNEVPELHADYKYGIELPANWMLVERMENLQGVDREVWREIVGEEGASVKYSKQREVAMKVLGPRKGLKGAFRPIAEMIRKRLVGRKAQTGQDRTSTSGPSDRLLAVGPRVILLLAELKLPSSLTEDRVGNLEAKLDQTASLSFGVTKEEEIISVGHAFRDKAFMQIALEFQRYEQFGCQDLLLTSYNDWFHIRKVDQHHWVMTPPIARLQASKNLTGSTPQLPTPLALLTALPARLIQSVLESHKKGKKRESK